ncbi:MULTISPECIES: nucleotide exchange factor GrpE [Methanoculleus]|uniref:Protein GrpE n=2 Tax=Methanoculleus TaxID=45989 RepID=A3CUE5_METMJ|nr:MULTISPECIES: nucleotide exchange factor GrpE [Methanoculleus]ABN56995.1 GrpE protein [Methanoculleus marisnigri JR1]MCC7556863.1 nucleotide exchange factor GrpE [Methanoculleus marisnigri]UYU18415.1 nucleotide exchange factor GrpE [Methanoculleus submarinus]
MKEDTSEPNEKQQNLANEADAASPALEELQNAYDDLNSRYLRLAADFDNYRKRMDRELDARTTFAIENFAVELLEVVDNFERAERAEGAGLPEGMEQIKKLFMTILERHGITPIECRNLPFDPERHEAIAYVPSDAGEGTVIDEAVRGYCMQDKVIRCAKVVVSKGMEE